jgi:RNA polymerase sigma-70 factor (ECF subfamily)
MPEAPHQSVEPASGGAEEGRREGAEEQGSKADHAIGYYRVVQWDSDTAIGGPEKRFPSTRHKLLEDAKDLTQSFFANAVERELFRRFEPAKASFRTYLRMAVERFAANQYEAANREKRGGGVPFDPVDENTAATISPEDQFERDWQRQLFALALDDLRAHCQQSGRVLQFAIFEAYDLADGERPSYAQLAARHGIAEAAVTNYLAWVRRTLRALVTSRVRGVTADESELREEMHRIWS